MLKRFIIVFLLLVWSIVFLTFCEKNVEVHKKNKAFSLINKLPQICELQNRYKYGHDQFPGKGKYANFDDLRRSFSWSSRSPNFEEQEGYLLKIILGSLGKPSLSGNDAYYIIATPSSDVGFLPYGFSMDQNCQIWKFRLEKDFDPMDFTKYHQIRDFINSLPDSALLKNKREIYNIDY